MKRVDRTAVGVYIAASVRPLREGRPYSFMKSGEMPWPKPPSP